MSQDEMPKSLVILSLTVGVVLIGWAVLLSPPLEFLRNALHIQAPPFGRAIVVGGQEAAQIINADPKAAEEYLSRIAFLYHGVFAILMAMVVYVGATVFSFKPEYKKPLFAITTVGYLFVVSGGIFFAYWVKDMTLHGIFVAGLALLFGAGIIFALGLRIKENGKIDFLSLNVLFSAAFLLVTAIIGGWVGANQTVVGDQVVKGLIAARFNPDIAEAVMPWRAVTAHEHAMVALLGAAITFILFKYFAVRSEGRIIKGSLILALAGQAVMAGAAWLVWPFGSSAHLAISPAASVLLLATGLVALADLGNRVRLDGFRSLITTNLARFTSYLLVLSVWATVGVPGVLVAISLRQPMILSPEFRNSIWDWARNAFDIGHWHVLIFVYGAALFVLFMDVFKSGRISKFAAGLLGASALVATVAINFYMIPANPGPYVPNPYNNPILTFFVEPALGVFALSVALGYIYILYQFMKQQS